MSSNIADRLRFLQNLPSTITDLDPESSTLYAQYIFAISAQEQLVPIDVAGDGYCLFAAILCACHITGFTKADQLALVRALASFTFGVEKHLGIKRQNTDIYGTFTSCQIISTALGVAIYVGQALPDWSDNDIIEQLSFPIAASSQIFDPDFTPITTPFFPDMSTYTPEDLDMENLDLFFIDGPQLTKILLKNRTLPPVHIIYKEGKGKKGSVDTHYNAMVPDSLSEICIQLTQSHCHTITHDPVVLIELMLLTIRYPIIARNRHVTLQASNSRGRNSILALIDEIKREANINRKIRHTLPDFAAIYRRLLIKRQLMTPPSPPEPNLRSSEQARIPSPQRTAHQHRETQSPPTLQQFQQMQQGYESKFQQMQQGYENTLEIMRAEMAAATKAHAATLTSMQHQIDQLTAASATSAALLADTKAPASETETLATILKELRQDIANLQKDRALDFQAKTSSYETPRANRSLFDTLFKDPADTAFGLKTGNPQAQSSPPNLSTNDLSKSTSASSTLIPVPSSSFVNSATAPTLHRIEYKFMTRFVSAVRQYYGKGGHLHIHTMLTETVQDQLRDLWSLLHQTNPSTIVSHSEWQSHNPQILLQQEQMMAQFITFITTHFAVQCSLHTSGKPAPQITSIKSLNNVIHEFYEIKSTLHLTGQKDPIINDHLLICTQTIRDG